jgi:ABC-type branched-subunit amino acid transport system substrate-binding protein
MISVRNHRPLLSGSKWLVFLIAGLLAAACSPKLQPVSIPVKKETERPVEKKPAVVIKPAKAVAADKVSVVSLMLPFGLNHLVPGSPYTSVSLKKADIALDYYRGFKLALDSLAGQGYNYKLQVFDTRDDKALAHSLANNPNIRSSDLIVGPVFPDDVKAFVAAYPNGGQPIVSPLSPASPATIKSPQLITMMPPLEYHAWGAARYIYDKMEAKKVFILKSGYSEENEYTVPFKRAIDSLSKRHIKVIFLTVIHGQLGTLIPQLSATETNVFLLPATNQHFLTVTLRALDTLNNMYPVTVFGHPGWAKLSFLKADLLQRLNTHITSAEHVDYKAEHTVTFMRDYRRLYHVEPTEFAIKGFDEGLYLGKLAANDELKNLSHADFAGLHNSFHFQKKTGLGWVNTHVNILKYSNFELKQVE